MGCDPAPDGLDHAGYRLDDAVEVFRAALSDPVGDTVASARSLVMALDALAVALAESEGVHYPDWHHPSWSFSTPRQSTAFVECLAADPESLSIVSDVDETLTRKRSTLARPAVLPGVPALWRLFPLLGVPSGVNSGRTATQLLQLFVPDDTPTTLGVVGLFGAQHAPAGTATPRTDPRLLDPSWHRRIDRFVTQHHTHAHQAAGIQAVLKLGPDGQTLMVAMDWLGAPAQARAHAERLGRKLRAAALADGFLTQGGAGVFDVMHPEVPPVKAAGFLPMVHGPRPILLYGGDSGSDNDAIQAAELLSNYAAGGCALSPWFHKIFSVAVAGPHTPVTFSGRPSSTTDDITHLTLNGPPDYLIQVHIPVAKLLLTPWMYHRPETTTA